MESCSTGSVTGHTATMPLRRTQPGHRRVFPSRQPFRSLFLGKIQYALFVPKGLVPAKPQPKRSPLEGLPLAGLGDASGSQVWRALESHVQKKKVILNLPARLSTYPALLEAVHSGKVAAVLPTLASLRIDPAKVEVMPLPLLATLEREVRVIWSRKMIELRPNLDALIHRLADLLRQVLRSH